MDTPSPTASPALPPTASQAPQRLGMAGLCVLITVLVIWFHIASGSNASELGSHPDEAAHFVTGLMVRDYLAGGPHGSPLHYADEYYRHYPKIGLGIWPPFFYLVQAAWTTVFPASAGTVLTLMALLGLELALVTGWWLWREYGWVEAVAGAVLLTALPLIQQYSNMVMAEMLSALLMFGAAGYFARYLEGAEWRGALGFGICAGLAIMTKGTGLALVFLPAIAILLTGRYGLLKRPSLWVAALVAGVIAGPWTWHFRNQGRGGWEQPSPSLRFTETAMGYYGREMCVALGWMLAALAVAGAVRLCLPGGRKPAIAICSVALVVGVWIFQCLMPVGLEARHLTPAMPALICLAMTGLHWGAGRLGTGGRAALAAGVLAVFFGWPALVPPHTPLPGYGSLGNTPSVSPFRVPRKEWSGYGALADAALGAGARHVLVAADARGEGMFIAEMAVRDPHRPGYTVERASKILASSTWSGSGYEAFFTTPGQVAAALAHAGIDAVVTDQSPATISPHQQLLQNMLDAAGSPYRLDLEGVVERDGKEFPTGLRLYVAAPH